jgi:uncharacterized protein (DUF58 family)
MNRLSRFGDWLESRWLIPSYGGGVLIAIALCFFGAAINTMAGWLYVISGTIFALLIIAGFFALRSVKHLKISRASIPPVSAGESLPVELTLENPTPNPRTLLQLQDFLPFVLGKPATTPIEAIPPKGNYHWVYDQPTEKRGVYHWQEVQIRSGNPLGLFWCRRRHAVPAKAIVYPPVLPLTRCPLVDVAGQEDNAEFYSDQYVLAATEGVTKALRPYRIGDPIRLIHWRSSAKLGEFQVRELEVFTGGHEVIIALDTSAIWNKDIFEEAVIAAASLYFYALHQPMNVKLWTASTGLVQGNIPVLQTLAATDTEEAQMSHLRDTSAVIWITQNPLSMGDLPQGSRWVLFGSEGNLKERTMGGIVVNLEESLQLELQKPLR